MRWLMLLAVISGILWTAKWSYHYLDDTFLITDIWDAKNTPVEWGLVHFNGAQTTIHGFIGTRGFWDIFTGLWPVWTLFMLSFFVLLPLSIYIYNGYNHAQITAAKKAQLNAEEQARKAESNAKAYEQKTKSWADERVRSANEEQEKLIRAELENETQYLHQFKNDLIQREQSLSVKERENQIARRKTEEQFIEIKQLYAKEQQRFKTEIAALTRSRDNAQAGQQRLKKEKQSIENFLDSVGWTLGDTPLTYKELKALSKEKQL